MPRPYPVRVVFVHQNQSPSPNQFIQELDRVGVAASIQVAGTDAELRSQLALSPDVVLALDGGEGADVLAVQRIVAETAGSTPVIAIALKRDEERAVECLRSGIAEYLFEDQLARLGILVARLMDAGQGSSSLVGWKSGAFLRDLLHNRRPDDLPNHAHRILDQVLSSLEEVIIVQSPQSRVIEECSAAVKRVLGFEPEEVIGTTTEIFFESHEAFRELGKDILAELDRGGVYTGEQWLRRKDGRRICVDVTVTEIRSSENERIAMVGSIRDITARKRTEADLVERERQLEQIIQQMPTPIAIGHVDGVIQMVNRAFLDLFGISNPAQFVDHFNPLSDTFVASKGLTDLVARAAQGETVFVSDVQLVPDPSWSARYGKGIEYPISAEITFFPVLRESGEVWRIVSIWNDTTERKQAEKEMQRRLKELQALQSVALAGAEATCLNELVVRVSQIVGEQIYTDSFGIALIDQEKSVINCHFVSSLDPQEPYFPLRLDQGVVGRVARTGIPSIVPDVRGDPDYLERYPAVRAELAVPITKGDRVIGVINVENQRVNSVDQSDLEYLITMAGELGNAVEKVRLQEQTQRQLERLTALRKIDESILASPDLEHTLDVLIYEITSLLHVDGAGFLLYDPTTDLLRVTFERGMFGALKRPLILKMGESHSGRVALERKMEFIPDLRVIHDELTANIDEIGEDFTSFLAMPLIAKDELKGVLELFSRAPLDLDPDWMSFLEALAGQAAIAIDSAMLFREQNQTNERLIHAYDATLDGWSHALDLRDKETEGHSYRVAELTLKLAVQLGVPESQIAHIRRGAQLHDIGKMGIPDSILLKPGPLTEDEWAIMRQHPLYALDMLYPIEFLQPALDIPYCHHEKWDGTGYPQGLKGTEIPLAARIFAVVDVWDALTSNRSYRPAWSATQALKYIREQAGKHFDPQVVDEFLKLVGENVVPQRPASRDYHFIAMDD
jgi:PAS domain S-box-containing protein